MTSQHPIIERRDVSKIYRLDNRRSVTAVNRVNLRIEQGDFVEGDTIHLGDIVIATPTARRQAKKQGHAARTEFVVLVIHGLLHLLGHDHAKKRETEKMFRLQSRLLKKEGIDV